MGISPQKIALLILKINVYLFILTFGISVLSFFPYYMHLTQISNNIAMDVANRNYINTSDVSKFVGHLNASPGQNDSTAFSLMTFRESDFDGRVVDGDREDISQFAKDGGVTVFSREIEAPSDSYALSSGGNTTVALSVKALSGSKSGKSLIASYGASSKFDPLNKEDHLVDGMTGNQMKNNSILVNRGTPFKVSLLTRYKLTAGTLGFMFHSGIPVEMSTVGVTTQYYQYDSE